MSSCRATNANGTKVYQPHLARESGTGRIFTVLSHGSSGVCLRPLDGGADIDVPSKLVGRPREVARG